MLKRALVTIAMMLLGLGSAAPVFSQTQVRPAELRGEADWIYHYERPAWLPAGLYEVRRNGGWCLMSVPESGLNAAHFETDRCGGEFIALVPLRGGRYWLRPAVAAAERRRLDGTTLLGDCATVSRAVVLGYKRMDIKTCVPTPVQFGNATPDQWFTLIKMQMPVSASGNTTNRFQIEADGLCADTEEYNVSRHETVFMKACLAQDFLNNRPTSGIYYTNTLYEFIYREPLIDDVLIQQALRLGWVTTPDGMRKAVPIRGFDLMGMDYWDGASADDGGRSCALKCAADTMCRAFTWKAAPPAPKMSIAVLQKSAAREGILGAKPQVVPAPSGAAAHCWLKNAVPGRSENPETASGIVRP